MGAGKFSAGSGNRRQLEAELVNRLRRLPVGELPDKRFKAELRSQLVAIAPRIVAESGAEASTATAGQRRPSRIAVLRRPLLAFTAGAMVLVLLLSLAIWMAGGALPGQSLYGIKRASENFQLSVAGSDTGKAAKYLQFAASRATESSKLAGAARTDPHAALLIASALRSADADTRNAVRLLNDEAVSQVSATPMAPLPSWLSKQRARIAALAPQLPAGPAASQATASLVLLQQAAVRVNQLKAELGCACLSQARSDALGPLPCTSCLGKRPNAPGLPGLPGSGSSGLPPLPTGLPSGLSSVVPTSPSLPGLGGSGSAPLPSGASGLPTGLPGLPSGLPSPPASVGTSGGSVGLPGVSIGAGPGGISISISPTVP